MKRVLQAHPQGNRLFEITDGEFARLEHLLTLPDPPMRARWVDRFLSERVPRAIYRPGRLGPPEDIVIDLAIGGNQGTRKWGRKPPELPGG